MSPASTDWQMMKKRLTAFALLWRYNITPVVQCELPASLFHFVSVSCYQEADNSSANVSFSEYSLSVIGSIPVDSDEDWKVQVPCFDSVQQLGQFTVFLQFLQCCLSKW